MREIVTRWTCDRCGLIHERPGDAGRPAAWRSIDFNLHHSNHRRALCGECVRSLEQWLAAGGET